VSRRLRSRRWGLTCRPMQAKGLTCEGGPISTPEVMTKRYDSCLRVRKMLLMSHSESNTEFHSHLETPVGFILLRQAPCPAAKWREFRVYH
jgi:hypothetical protein